MKKFTMVIVLIVCLLFTVSVIVSAEMLFGVSAETGPTNLTADYLLGTTYDVTKSPNMLILNGNLNLLGTHIDLEYGSSNMDIATFSTASLRVGWELGLKVLKVKLSGGYHQFQFADSRLSPVGNNLYASVGGGLGVESKIDKFTIQGMVFVPVYTHYTNGGIEDSKASLSYASVGVAYAPLPLFDVLVNYRAMKADSTVLSLLSTGYSVGVKFSF